MDDALRSTTIFPLNVRDEPLYQDEYGDTWDIRLAHDQDGYGLGLRIDARHQRLQLLLSGEDAERLGGALLSASAYARALNHLRAERN